MLEKKEEDYMGRIGRSLILKDFWVYGTKGSRIGLAATYTINVARAFCIVLAPVFLTEGIEAVANQAPDDIRQPVTLFGKEAGNLKPSEFLYIWVTLLAAEKMLKAINKVIISNIQTQLSEALVKDKFLPKLHQMTIEYIETTLCSTQPTNIISKLTESTSDLLSNVVNELVPMFFYIILMSATLGASALNGWIGIILSYLGFTLFVNIYTAWVLKKSIKLTQSRENLFLGNLREDISFARTIRIYNKTHRHLESEKKLFHSYTQQIKVNDTEPAMLDLITVQLLFAAYTLGTIIYYSQGDITKENLNDLILIINYLVIIYASAKTVGSSIMNSIKSITYIDQLEDHINNSTTESNNQNGAVNAQHTQQDGWVDGIQSVPIVEFERVSLVKGDKRILDNVSFKMESGKSYAFIGSSGSGKTTIFELLCGFQEPTSGVIKIKGRPISEMSKEELRLNITLLNQKTELFTKMGSGCEDNALPFNILYGHSDSEAAYAIRTDAEINVSAEEQDTINDRKTKADLTGLPDKMHAFSGGEQQRVGWARAWKATPIMLLDEPTSSQDSITEAKLVNRLNEFMEENADKIKLLVVTAHRLNTIKDCDVTFVMSKGKIVDAKLRDGVELDDVTVAIIAAPDPAFAPAAPEGEVVSYDNLDQLYHTGSSFRLGGSLA